MNVDLLRDKDLVELRENPAPRRSPLVALSHKGRAAFGKIRRREQEALATLANGLRNEDVTAALRVLQALRKRLEQATLGKLGDE